MKTAAERIDPQLAEALATLPKTAAGVFDLNDIDGTRAAILEMTDAANAATIEVSRALWTFRTIKYGASGIRPPRCTSRQW